MPREYTSVTPLYSTLLPGLLCPLGQPDAARESEDRSVMLLLMLEAVLNKRSGVLQADTACVRSNAGPSKGQHS